MSEVQDFGWVSDGAIEAGELQNNLGQARSSAMTAEEQARLADLDLSCELLRKEQEMNAGLDDQLQGCGLWARVLPVEGCRRIGTTYSDLHTREQCLDGLRWSSGRGFAPRILLGVGALVMRPPMFNLFGASQVNTGYVVVPLLRDRWRNVALVKCDESWRYRSPSIRDRLYRGRETSDMQRLGELALFL
jgi:hypothetical protein